MEEDVERYLDKLSAAVKAPFGSPPGCWTAIPLLKSTGSICSSLEEVLAVAEEEEEEDGGKEKLLPKELLQIEGGETQFVNIISFCCSTDPSPNRS